MEKKYLYFQPEYVGKFKCDGANCPHNCCEQGWNIEIDKATYNQYRKLKPESKAQEIIRHFVYYAKSDKYFLEGRPCPFLDENKLCRIQRELGEKFLSLTCATYPRYTRDFGKYFERSLTLSCPIAAKMILLPEEPMKFEFVEVSEKIHSGGGKIGLAPVYTLKEFSAHILEIQVAMISILQERTLSINQRLIVLGFFLDKLDELISAGCDENALVKLLSVYESKNFLAEQVPRMVRAITFNSQEFIRLMLVIIDSIYSSVKLGGNRKYLDAVTDVLGIMPDENKFVATKKVADNYNRLAAARKNFLDKYSPFLENFLVNELFMNCYPWRLEESIAKNYGVFIATYKIFELMIFAATTEISADKKDLLKLVDWFSVQFDHVKEFPQIISEHIAGDIFELMESLLEQ